MRAYQGWHWQIHGAIFVLEDDAQNGPDHVDSHRSLMFAISPGNGAMYFAIC